MPDVIPQRAIGDQVICNAITDLNGGATERDCHFIAPFDCWIKQIFITPEDDSTSTVTLATALGNLSDTVDCSVSAGEVAEQTFARVATNNFIPAGSWISVTSDGGGTAGARANVMIVLGRASEKDYRPYAQQPPFNIGRMIYVCVEAPDDNITVGARRISFPFAVQLRTVWTYTTGAVSGGSGALLSGARDGAAGGLFSNQTAASGTNTITDETDHVIDAVIEPDMNISLAVLGLATSSERVLMQCGFEAIP